MTPKYPVSREITSGPVKRDQCLFPVTSQYYDREILFCRKPVTSPTSPTLCFAHYALVYELS